MCWVAIRRIPSLLKYEIVQLYARRSLREDPELAAQLEQALVVSVGASISLAVERRPFNPFLELRK